MFLKMQKIIMMDGKKIVYGFKNGILPFHLDKNMHTDNIKDENGLINYKELDRSISLKKWYINDELVKKTLFDSGSEIIARNIVKKVMIQN